MNRRVSCLFLLGLMLQRSNGAEAQPVGATNRGSFLLIPAKVFTSEDSKSHEGWTVLVTSNKIAAVGLASEIKVPGGRISVFKEVGLAIMGK
jgi:hypothetical protein